MLEFFGFSHELHEVIHKVVPMPRSSASKYSVRSVSPVSPTEAELNAALEALNNSLDSRGLTDLTGSRFGVGNDDPTVRMSELSPTLVTDDFLDKDTSVLLKCQTLIDDLQSEVDRLRDRNGHLESDLKDVRAKLAGRSAQDNQTEILQLKQQLADALDSSRKKDLELENMTKHFEKRLDEMKRQLKQQGNTSQAPTMNSIDQDENNKLREKLRSADKKLASQASEMKSIIDSYERQLKILKEQLDQSQEFFKAFYAAKSKGVEVSEHPQRSNPFRDY